MLVTLLIMGLGLYGLGTAFMLAVCRAAQREPSLQAPKGNVSLKPAACATVVSKIPAQDECDAPSPTGRGRCHR